MIIELQASKIWSNELHCAFTDLVKHQGVWYCAFRQASDHMSYDGQILILQSKDTIHWQEVCILSGAGDLRDPKFICTPQGKLVLFAALRVSRQEHGYSHQTYAWTMNTSGDWGQAQTVGERDLWLWRVAFQGKLGLGVAYKVGGDYHTRLYHTENGIDYQVVKERLREQVIDEYSNESGLCFDEKGQAWCLLRRDPQSALLGVAKPPYQHWQWLDTKVRVGGPVLAFVGGRLLAVVRLYTVTDNKITGARTSLAWLAQATGELTECGQLPSGGDTSYAGLVVEDGAAYISYYSTHEGKSNQQAKTAIYFAKVPLHTL